MPYKDKAKQAEYCRKWQQGKGRSSAKAAKKACEQRLREEVTAIKANAGCLDCGSKVVSSLEFHHLDPSTKEFWIADQANGRHMGRKRIMEEIAKCVVLCSRCHKARHRELDKAKR